MSTLFSNRLCAEAWASFFSETVAELTANMLNM